MALTPTQLSCRIGTIRLPRSYPLQEAELAGMIEVELAELLRWSPPWPAPQDVVVRSPHLAVDAPSTSPPVVVARLIALEIYQRIQHGGVS